MEKEIHFPLRWNNIKERSSDLLAKKIATSIETRLGV